MSTESIALPTGKPAPRFRFDPRYIAPLLISCVLLGAHLQFKILESWDRTATAILSSILTEVVLGLLVYKKVPHLASAYVSGISVGILIRSPFFWPYAITAAIATSSKYVVRWKGRHLWNPSNFAIGVMIILAPSAVATLGVQFDNRVWAMMIIWALGSFIISKLKRFHICLTYVICFVTLAWVRSLLTGHPFLSEVSPITGPMYQLFTLFMITDPKTTVSGKKAQIAVVVLIAVVESILRYPFQNIHAPYYALFLVGPIANAVEIWQQQRKAPIAASG